MNFVIIIWKKEYTLLGDSWIREYGIDIDVLHFHNYLEIGVCRFGEGTMEFGEEIRDYSKGWITVITKNFPHTTNSKPGTKSHWEYLFIDADNLIANNFPNARDANNLLDNINSGVFYFHDKEYPEIADKIYEIMEIYREQKKFFIEETESLLKSLLIRISREQEKDKRHELTTLPVMETKSSSTILKALEYIEEHYSEDIKIGN